MSRIRSLAESLADHGIDGMLVTNLTNVRYLTGFRGSSACLLLAAERAVFCTDFRYEQQARTQVRGCDILIEREERPKEVLERARDLGIRTLGFETTVPYALYRKFLRKGVRMKAVANLVEDRREVKERSELQSITRAVRRAEAAFLEVQPHVRIGVTERQIALLLEEKLKGLGCASVPFPIIVASGPNSALPHAQPTDRKVGAGDLVVIDWGGEADGYFSDMTRTLLMRGSDAGRKREICSVVLRANREAVAGVRAGQRVRMVDKVARDIIKKAGYDEYFGHGTGHGVGLDVHELPRISRFGRGTIRRGMVFTVEPGIYLPGVGGVRIEDMVVAGTTGCTVLTALAREPQALC